MDSNKFNAMLVHMEMEWRKPKFKCIRNFIVGQNFVSFVCGCTLPQCHFAKVSCSTPTQQYHRVLQKRHKLKIERDAPRNTYIHTSTQRLWPCVCVCVCEEMNKTFRPHLSGSKVVK